jgi:hypothetical protein
MKKMLAFLFVAGMAVNIACAQSTWITYPIDAKLSVKVPTQPTKADQYSVMSMGNDSCVYVITKVDMKVAAGLDSATLVGLAPTQEFADGLKSGMLEKMQGYTMGDVKTSKWNGYYSYSVDADNPTTKIKSYTFMIIMGSYLYSLSAVLPESKTSSLKDTFFSSLKLN